MAHRAPRMPQGERRDETRQERGDHLLLRPKANALCYAGLLPSPS